MKVWIRGAGELASATALTLHRCGFSVFLSELPVPLAIRRTVTFSDAMIDGTASVEEVTARRVAEVTPDIWSWDGIIPIGLDEPTLDGIIKPEIFIDGRMLKKTAPDLRNRAVLAIGLGPGFTAGKNCHAVIETHRGHDLGLALWKGSPLPDTSVPGNLGGATRKRVLYAPSDGVLEWKVTFGDQVRSGDVLGLINGVISVKSTLTGLVRGLIHPQVTVTRGLKIGDVDPRGAEVNYRSISDKARAVGRGCLETIFVAQNKGLL